MFRIPARCRKCGHTFPSSFLAGSEKNTSFLGCTTTCPKCEGIADVLSGDFVVDRKQNDDGSSVEDVLFRNPVSTSTEYVLLDRKVLIPAVEKALTAAVDEKDFEKSYHEINRVSPQLAQEIRKYTRKSGLVLWVPFLFAILRSCTVHVDAQIDINALFTQVIDAIEHNDPHPIEQNHTEDQNIGEAKRSTEKQKQDTKLPQKENLKQQPEQRSERKAPRQPSGKRTGRHKK